MNCSSTARKENFDRYTERCSCAYHGRSHNSQSLFPFSTFQFSLAHTQIIPLSPTHCLPITGLVKSCYLTILPMLTVFINPCPQDSGLNFPLIHISVSRETLAYCSAAPQQTQSQGLHVWRSCLFTLPNIATDSSDTTCSVLTWLTWRQEPHMPSQHRKRTRGQVDRSPTVVCRAMYGSRWRNKNINGAVMFL